MKKRYHVFLALAGPHEDNRAMMMLEDRRRKRSADPLVALHYQLTSARKQGVLDTIVLADETGVVVAGSGAWAACEELAAYAPLLAQGTETSERIDAMRPHVHVRVIQAGSTRVLLCAKANPAAELVSARTAIISRTAAGITRILEAA